MCSGISVLRFAMACVAGIWRGIAQECECCYYVVASFVRRRWGRWYQQVAPMGIELEAGFNGGVWERPCMSMCRQTVGGFNAVVESCMVIGL